MSADRAASTSSHTLRVGSSGAISVIASVVRSQNAGNPSMPGASTASGIAMNGMRVSGRTKQAYGTPCAAAWNISGA